MMWFSFSQIIAKASAVQWLRPQRKCIFREFEGQWRQRFDAKAANVQGAKKCNLYAECCDIEAEYKIIPGAVKFENICKSVGTSHLPEKMEEKYFMHSIIAYIKAMLVDFVRNQERHLQV